MPSVKGFEIEAVGMYLRHLKLRNFRRFGSISVDFDPKMTVIAAINGEGKTTLLESIAIALGPFVGAFPKGKARHIVANDARRIAEGHNAIYPVEIEAELGEPAINWNRALRAAKSKTTIGGAAPLSKYARALYQQTDINDHNELPLVAWYSSRRLWINHRDTTTKRPTRDDERSAGYEDCLSDASSYTQMSRWIERSTSLVVQNTFDERDTEATQALTSRIKAIQDAVNRAVEPMQFRGFRYSLRHKCLTLSHDDHGEMSLSLLSDGIRAVTTLVADMAFRATLLNPHLGGAVCEKISGIVLINEIDLHLHPSWQQQIVGSLRNIFPNIQFIISTHSPQVLATVPGYQVRVIRRDSDATTQGSWEALQPRTSSLGRDSSHVLANIMDVDPSPLIEEISSELAEYELLVREGKEESDLARSLKVFLEDKGYGFTENELRMWRMIAQRKMRLNG